MRTPLEHVSRLLLPVFSVVTGLDADLGALTAGDVRIRHGPRPAAVLNPFGDVALPVADPADPTGATARDGHAGQAYVITGPETVTPRHQAEVIAEALGEEVTYVDLTHEAVAEQRSGLMPLPGVEGNLDTLGSPLPAGQHRRGEGPATPGPPLRGPGGARPADTSHRARHKQKPQVTASES
ncbi:hypothetical protein [Streptomyces sp. NPDC014623]|uniref:hypothetical protein n=1 Tax=Streptomyces sp. NPDC014623 TaxID=3364875 RepID=UPI0036FEAD9E